MSNHFFSLALCLMAASVAAQNAADGAVQPAERAMLNTKMEAAKPDSLPIALPDEAAFFGALDLEQPELAPVRIAVQARDWTAAKAAWARHLETRANPRWLWSRHDKAQIMRLLDAKGASLTRSIKPADAVLRREFNPQGVPYQLEKNINWKLPNSEETHVLSRFGYWRDMGQAYWATGDAKYAADFVYILNDWLADNPPPSDLSGATKPNTTWRTLETGIRADTWWDVMQLFMDAPEFDAQAKYLMSKSLMEHARYLYEWTPKFRGGNKQVIEAGGLTMTGIMLPEVKEASAWRARGLQRLAEHMEQDVLPDGGHSELTPGYHVWVMSQFARIAQLCKLNGYKASGLTSRHEKMYEWLMNLSQPDHRVPAIGDAHVPVNIEEAMAMGALLYNRPDMRYLGSKDGPASWLWLFGADAFDRYDKVPSRRPGFTSVMLPQSKYITMRTGWEKDDPYLLFDCAPWGGQHSHQDALQVLLHAGRDLLIDPGIYSYNQPLSSSYFRTNRAHNVLMIDGKEAQQSNDPKSNPQVVAWQTKPQADFASGIIEQDGVQHQRSVLFVKPNYWVVVDHVAGAGEHEVKRLFHFSLGAANAQGNIARTAFETGTNLQLQVADDARLEMDKGWVPTQGAKAEASSVATFVSQGKLPMTLCTVLTPFVGPNEIPTVENLPGDDPQIARIRLTFPNGQCDEIAVSSAVTLLQIGPHQAQGRALVVRQGPQSNATMALDGSAPLTR